MLRPALELAWVVAKTGTEARPAVSPPGRLRPLMRFAKLPDRALTTVRQVVEEDAEFRARVAEWAGEAKLDRAPWLWLVRPDGWEEELGTMADAAGVAATEQEEAKEERSARRRLDAAQRALTRAEAELVRLGQANADLLEDLTAERQGRRQAESEHDASETARRIAEEDRARLHQRVVSLEGQVASLARDLEATAEQLTRSNQQGDSARAEITSLHDQLRQAGAEVARVQAGQDDVRGTVSLGVDRAAAAARELSEALGDLATTIRGRPPPDTGEGSPPAPTSEMPAPRARSKRAPTAPRQPVPPTARQPVPPTARQPVALPPAVFDDSFEAAEYLVRMRGILLIVDGYNVTISSWPHLELPRQRHHLVDALAELAMRTGLKVHVVFDGTDLSNRFEPPPAARRRMRVTFSPDGVEADEVILTLVDQLDPAQPVVVATDDREVRDGVRRRGANVISVAQLLAVLRRAPGSATG
jgi:predicted RNA-binding protein with PIN domain